MKHVQVLQRDAIIEFKIRGSVFINNDVKNSYRSTMTSSIAINRKQYSVQY